MSNFCSKMLTVFQKKFVTLQRDTSPKDIQETIYILMYNLKLNNYEKSFY